MRILGYIRSVSAAVVLTAAVADGVAQQPPRDSVERASYAAHLAAAEKALRLNEGPEAQQWLSRAPLALRGWEWAHLDAAADQSLRSVPAPGADMTALAVSADGRHAAGADLDGRIYLWRTSDWTPQRTIAGHDDAVYSVAFSGDGERLVSVSRDVTARVWRVSDGAELARLKLNNPGVAASAFSPDGRCVATCSWVSNDPDQPAPGVCGSVWIWNAANGEVLSRTFPGVKPLDSIAFAPDGQRIYVGSWGGLVHVLDAAGHEVSSIKLPDEGIYNAVMAVAVSADGKWLAVGSKDRTARVYDVESQNLLSTLRGHGGFVTAVDFSPGGDSVVTGSADASLRIWDWRDEKQRARLFGNERPVSEVFWRARRLLTLARDNTIREWSPEVQNGARLDVDPGAGATYTATFTPDGKQIAAACYSGHVLLIDSATGATVADWNAHPDSTCNTLSISGDGKLLVTCSWDKTARVWDVATQSQRHSLDAGAGINHCAISADGDRVALAVGDTVQLWDLSSARRTAEMRGHEGAIQEVAFSPDGTLVASAAADKTVRLWDAKTGESRQVIGGFESALSCVAFAPSGRLLVVGDRGGSVVLCDVEGAQRQLLLRTDASINRVAFSPDGRRVAAASERLHILDPVGGGELLRIAPHRDTIWHLSFSPDGRRLASCSWDGTIVVSESTRLSERMTRASTATQATRGP